MKLPRMLSNALGKSDALIPFEPAFSVFPFPFSLVETNFFTKKVRNELDFSEMNARLNYMPDAGVAQW